ncbi:hypothetical protein B0H34DRAFT_816222, partial [Crassisporium funariophilum]
DFNLVEEQIDRLPPHKDTQSAVASLAALKRIFNLHNGWRHKNPDKLAYSFSQVATGAQSHIDQIYVSTPIWAKGQNWDITIPPLMTDHNIITMEFGKPRAP